TILRTLGSPLALQLTRDKGVESPPLSASYAQPGAPSDPLIQRMLDLQAQDPTVVRQALSTDEVLDPVLIAPAIRLLARDDLSEHALRALRQVAPTAVGQLTDALLNADQDFAVRRRVPRVLATYASARTVEGLLHGLRDSRF